MSKYVICSHCGEKLVTGVRFCSSCGFPVGGIKTIHPGYGSYDKQSHSVYTNAGNVFLDPLYELPFDNTHSNKKQSNEKPRKKRGCLSIIVIFIIFLTVFSLLIVLTGCRTPKTVVPLPLQTPVPTTLEEKDVHTVNYSHVSDSGISGEVVFDDDTTEEKTSTEYIKPKETETYKESPHSNSRKSTNYVFDDSEITNDEKSVCWLLAKDVVLSKLKAPSTAVFPKSVLGNDVVFSKSGNEYTVISYVDAQNTFGAMIRSSFIVTMEKSGYGADEHFTSTYCYIE